MRPILLTSLLLATTLWCQSLPPGAPIPPGSTNPPPAVYIPHEPVRPVLRVDSAALRREADELVALTSSVHSDVEALGRGLLDKDLDGKLRRIEKLSKHLRTEVAVH